MRIREVLLLVLLVGLVSAGQYTVDIDSSYVACITGCLVKEQDCNDILECVTEKANYNKCALSNRDACLISTPTVCNSVCYPSNPSSQFTEFLACRLKCSSNVLTALSMLASLFIVAIIF